MMKRLRSSLLLWAAVALLAAQPASQPGSKYLVYVGTYTGPNSKGIYAYRFDAAPGKLDSIGLVGEMVRPSFLALHPNGRFLYAVSELGNDGRVNGSVTGFAIDRQSGKLTALNTVSSGGGGACHLVVDKTGGNLLVANYGSGSAACFRLAQDGRIGERTALMQHGGTGPDARRQGGPHAHAVVLSPDNRFLLVPDLGLDKVFVYRFDASRGTLTANDPPFAAVPGGSGPRHLAFHPNGRYAYVVNEMKSSVTTFAYDGETGALRDPRTVSNLPDDFSGVDNSAEIETDAAGRFLYASNRGHDSITIYAIDPASGGLTTVDRVPTRGKTPRNFAIDPTGRYVFAANQDSDSIVVFSRDAQSGRLKPLSEVHVTAPVCIRFLAE